MRTFLALELPEHEVRVLEEFRDKLRSATRPLPVKLRWVRSELFHLTMRFFGEVSEAEAASIVSVVSDVVASRTAVPVQASPLGVFPHWGRPRVLWGGVEPLDDGLFSLFHALDDGFAEAGLGRYDMDEYHPHVTLARIKTSPTNMLRDTFEPFASEAWSQEMKLSTLTLFKSELGPSGAKYTPLQHWNMESS